MDKKKIAQIAKRFINEGDIVYISCGTITSELAKILFDVRDLIVFTNAINILLELVNNSDISVKLIGGDFRKKTFSMVGQEAIGYLDRYNFDKAFVGVNGVSTGEGFTTPNELEAIVDRKVVRKSKGIFILADESKFGAVAFSTICKIGDVNYIITNKQLNSSLARDIQENGVKIVYE
ncbi:MAG: DeoR/GlpR family DNA-binding transcription regulator [Candidatus Humimicrobiaceae bacterium]